MCHFPGHSFEGLFVLFFSFLWQFFLLGGGVNFILKWNVPTRSPKARAPPPTPFFLFLLSPINDGSFKKKNQNPCVVLSLDVGPLCTPSPQFTPWPLVFAIGHNSE
jgi:hypothetical protein